MGRFALAFQGLGQGGGFCPVFGVDPGVPLGDQRLLRFIGEATPQGPPFRWPKEVLPGSLVRFSLWEAFSGVSSTLLFCRRAWGVPPGPRRLIR
ncbi:MAG: hypothetical protein FWC43_04185 [Planctomycetaceae bacterium]|nr:hypothetical protein [Planctomycetaceae bacterium]